MTAEPGPRAVRLAVLAVATAALFGRATAAQPAASDVLEATLANGLRVVIVPNVIAPVVSTDLTYLVGSRDDPPDIPGLAHAQEHMMFRGTPMLSTSQLGTVATALGGQFNAGTSETLTQFQFTVPASDLDAVLRIEADRMHDTLDLQSQWQNERGAIEQEVARDDSAPGNDFFRDARAIAFAGSPYAHDGVGTRAAFDRLTGPRIKAFYERWYAPDNAVLVIAGNVDPQQTLGAVRAHFDAVPRRPVPAHAAAHFTPLRRTVLRRTTSLVYPLAAVGFRLPGVTSPDFLPAYVLGEILDAQRGPLHALADAGEALDGEWLALPYVPEAQLGFATAALRPGADPSAMVVRLEAILRQIAQHGVPGDLFTTTKRRLIAGQELSRNSTDALASDWATTIALDNEPSIAREQELIGKVTLAEVDRVAARYLDPQHAIIGALTPSATASQAGAPAAAQPGTEKPLAAQPAVTQLPGWATALIAHVAVPPSSLAPTRSTLPNGLTLIVQPESISDSVFVYGEVKTNAGLQEPPGKEGVARILAGMFAYGTRSLDLGAFRRAQDDLDATLAGGSAFGAQTPSASFDRALALLGTNELEPRFDDVTFAVAQRRAVDELATELGGTGAVAQHRAAEKLLPPGDPELRLPTVAGMQALTLADVRAYYRQTFRPDLTTVVVIGKVTPESARAAVERTFGAWQATGVKPNLELPPVPLNAPATVTIPIPSQQADVVLEELVNVRQADPHAYALQLGNAILGGGSLGPEQSRLFRDLRQNAGLVYNINSEFLPSPTRSRFQIAFASSPGNEARIALQLDSELRALQTAPPSAFELALVKASLVRRTVTANAAVASIGNTLLGDASDGLALDQPQRDAQALVATDADAVRQAFATYVRPQDFVRVIEGPSPSSATTMDR